MFSGVYFALSSGLALRRRLPDFCQAMLDGEPQRAYCLVDDVLERSRKFEAQDDVRLVAAADVSLLLGADQDAEELYRRAQKRVVGDDLRLRSLSCRNTGWQLMVRERYGAMAKCFARMASERQASPADTLEALVGLALAHHQVGRQGEADATLLRAAQLAEAHEEHLWRQVVGLLAREFDVQLQIRHATALSDHAFWRSALALTMCSATDRAALTRQLSAPDMASLPPLLAERHAYLTRLAQLAQGELPAPAVLLTLLHPAPGAIGPAQTFLARLDLLLAALAGGHDELAHNVLAKLGCAETDLHARRCNFDYLYCAAKVASRQGDSVQALKLYSNYASEALRCLRHEALGPSQRQSHQAAPADDISARLPPKYRRAYRYIIDNLERSDLSTREIAAQIDVTERALQLTFKRSLGMSPGSLVRRLRLDGIRDDLLSDDCADTSIFDTASRWGVKSRSAFAKGYRKQFNESPSETLGQ
ncbi:helix-turn-helix transcriptional regulator [Paraburkholderia bonniea]|uniref:helix-turn-helix transcriptional regulator n=1 Tax=Paraburkholderia bonniea TaxID=2152891 RepID=UPI0012910601|nr:helix-turn-helix transcriptional regulator [Paraburkholderia bonniea]WJF89336.1 helix-turn-helix transcriptional regulator [Paraburkholderia bonniea]WJF92652.1 helix-turn-helix transcriptional regulator [Paraburkholderia bonniea]